MQKQLSNRKMAAVTVVLAAALGFYLWAACRATVQLPTYGNSVTPLLTADTNGTALTALQRDSSGGGTVTTLYCSAIQNTGYETMPVVTKTSTYVMSGNEQVIEGNATGGAFPVDLPAASSVTGREYLIKKIDSSGNAVTVTANGADTIEGSATVSLSSQWSFSIVISDGTEWIKAH
jgi:hypothetical protein